MVHCVQKSILVWADSLHKRYFTSATIYSKNGGTTQFTRVQIMGEWSSPYEV